MLRYFFWIMLLVLMVIRIIRNDAGRITTGRVRIIGSVTTEPVGYEDRQRLSLAGYKFYLPLYPEIHYRETIVVEGEVNADNLRNPLLLEIKENDKVLYELRERLISFYKYSLPEPHASLVAGFVLGSKSGMPTSFWEQLKSTGTAYVFVASGMNVTLVAGFLLSVLIYFLPRKKAVPIAMTGVWVYAVLSGFDAPIVRAAIIGSIALTAQELGRVNITWRALIISAALILLINPGWLTDVGFILSFFTTASIIAFSKRTAEYLRRLPPVMR